MGRRGRGSTLWCGLSLGDLMATEVLRTLVLSDHFRIRLLVQMQRVLVLLLDATDVGIVGNKGSETSLGHSFYFGFVCVLVNENVGS